MIQALGKGVLGLLITLFMAEGASRLAGPELQALEHDPILGWRLQRSFHGSSLSTNSWGFHDLERPQNAPPGETRVLVIGDSYVAGLGVDTRELLHMQLERLLNVSVLQAAAPAWSTGQQLIWYQEEGKHLGARVVVLLVAPNDIRETYANAFHRLTPKNTLERNPPRSVPSSDRLAWWLLNHSTLANRLASLWNANRTFEIVRATWPFTFLAGSRNVQDYDLFRVEPAKEILTAQRLLQAEVAQLGEEVKRAGAELLVAVIPTEMERSHPLANDSSFRPGRVGQWVSQMGKELGIRVVDLSAIALKENPDLFLQDDYHFSPAGHLWIASRLADSLRSTLRTK